MRQLSLCSHDFLEWQGKDIRSLVQVERRQLLEALVKNLATGNSHRISPLVNAPDWHVVNSIA